jgi:hypothetical protein
MIATTELVLDVAPVELVFVEDSSLEFVGGGCITNNL